MSKIEGTFHIFVSIFMVWIFIHSISAEGGWFVFLSYLAIIGFLFIIIWILRLGYIFGLQLKTRYNKDNVK